MSPWFTVFSTYLPFGKVSLYIKNKNTIGNILIKDDGPTIISRVLLCAVLIITACKSYKNEIMFPKNNDSVATT